MPIFSYLLENFDYYAKPEGEDIFTKMVSLSTRGLITAGVISIYDANMYSQCKNFKEALNTVGFWVIPITGMCLTFCSVTYMATNIRKKDDKFNYILGALASGSILHIWTNRNWWLSGIGIVLLVGYAALKKDTKQHDYDEKMANPFMPVNLPHRWLFSWRNVPYRNYTPAPKYEHIKDYY